MARAQETSIEVEGMTCAHCERHVADALLRVPGVTRASASHVERRAVITADRSVAADALLRAAVEEAGYAPGDIAEGE